MNSATLRKADSILMGFEKTKWDKFDDDQIFKDTLTSQSPDVTGEDFRSMKMNK